MGKIIKGGGGGDMGNPQAPSGSHRVISGQKAAAKEEAQGIKERAQLEANDILEAARTEAEQLRQTTLEEAKQQGYEEGKNAGAQEAQQAVAALVARANQLEADIVPQLKALALTIAKKVIGKELEFHPELVVDLIRQALAEKARTRTEISLKVNPEDLAIVRESKADLLEVLSRCKEIGVREDPGVARYGVIIETDAGTIDAQLETQLDVFERVLKDMG